MTRRELAEATRQGPLAKIPTPDELKARIAKQNADLRALIERGTVGGGESKPKKARREMKNTEHRAQRMLYEELIPAAQTRYPPIARQLSAVYAIPNFNLNYGDKQKQKLAAIQGARYKAEGMKAGSPDNHVPVPMVIEVPGVGSYVYGSLFLELKAENYPNDAQRERFPLLASCKNAVVTIKEPDEYMLAHKALSCIVTYLLGGGGFWWHGHPSHTYVHNSEFPLAHYGGKP